jgi:N-acyl amino acid synthase of PEP-CTERM/exosortase system
MLSAKKQNRSEPFELDLTISRDPDHIIVCQRLRYKVYCVERGWYNEVQIHKGREYDQYDQRSVHALLNRQDNGDSIGVVRLVLPSGNQDDPDLPMQEMEPCPLDLMPPEIDITRMGEVSRFSVTQDYNRRATDLPDGERRQSIRGGLSQLSIKLMRAVVLMANENNVRYLCATMEPSLLMLLARVGVKFIPLGEPREYHGVRQPCYCDLELVEQEVKTLCPDKYPLIFGEG